MNSPAVSVVMPVRNALPYLDVAIESVLAQSFGDFELVIGDDVSTDGSRERIRDWARRDSRIQVFEAETPMGPVGSSNWVTLAATAPLVARMDADDIAYPDRLERQVAVMKANAQAVLIGTLFDSVDQHGAFVRGRNRASLLNRCGLPGIAHSTIMFRADAFREAGGYRDSHDYYEDGDLYLRMAQLGEVLVLPEAYLSYRFNLNSSRLTGDQRNVERALEASLEWHSRHFGTGPRVSPRNSEKASPAVFMALGSHLLWAGAPPRMLGRILRRAALSWNRESATLLMWGLWGSLSPASLRAFLRLRARRKDRQAGKVIRDGQVYRWAPNSGCAVAEAPAHSD